MKNNKEQYHDFTKEDLIKQLEIVEAAYKAKIQMYADANSKLLKILREYDKEIGNYNERCMYGNYKTDYLPDVVGQEGPEIVINRYTRIKEHLDKLPDSSLRICKILGGCACKGCAGWINGTRIREHELEKYLSETKRKYQK